MTTTHDDSSQLTRADLADMSPAAIVAANRAGQLDDLKRGIEDGKPFDAAYE